MKAGSVRDPAARGRQCAALPVLDTPEGVRVVMVTSRETRRWVLPKGWVDDGLTPHRAAAREALEEAGLEGEIERRPVGSYSYGKRLADGTVRECTVSVHLFHVSRMRDRWPEHDQRERRLFAPEEAAELVAEPELQSLLRGFMQAAG
ncbi:MAG TPA: NUDIX hydrolase [Acetobacteraceae bacterium]|jgi:8-oxo-dGTP pyrophosphatase MutT (NUDIX family)|nr:NUDIX hydrolase [Acetobacteraceae bacterium]